MADSPDAPHPSETAVLRLPANLVALLESEAKAHRKPIADYLAEWLQDQHDARIAMRRVRDLKAGKTKAIPAEQVYAKLGI